MSLKIEENMRSKLRYVASKLKGMETKEVGTVSLVDTHLDSDTFNTAFGGHISQEEAGT